VERVTLFEHGKVQPLWIPSSGCLPQSVTSLTINTNMVSLVQVRDIMGQLQNLDNLSLMGSLVGVPGRAPTGIGMAVRGRFCGELRLAEGYADEDVVNMLLEVPTGLHFTDVKVLGTRDCILSTARLAESCGKSLVKLLYTVSPHDGETFERSFDLSNLPNLKGVDFGVGWLRGGLLWIPVALSTLRLTTSPHLSTIQLTFIRSSTVSQSVQDMIKCTRNDLLSVADEVARIEREFGGVNVTVRRDSGFKEAFDQFNILQRSIRH